MPVILCVGCGKDVSDKVNNRINLCSDASLSVLMTWKDIFMQKCPEPGHDYKCHLNTAI